MINRTLVRTKVVQRLFSASYEEYPAFLQHKKEMLRSFSDTYSLYMLFFDFINEMVDAADNKIAFEIDRAKVRHEEYTPNMHFVNNRFAAQVFNNRQLRAYIEENHLGWDAAHESLRTLWKQIQESACYKAYMKLPETTYEDDKQVWRKIFTDVLADNEELNIALDELEVALDGQGWVTDANVVLSYVVKTVKRFSKETGADQKMLEMFDSEDELDFAKKLLKASLETRKDNTELIKKHLKNWEISRMPKMDIAILQVALAEITQFPNIALEISISEYLDIAREFSGEKSPAFINGILEEIVKELKAENKLIKAVMI